MFNSAEVDAPVEYTFVNVFATPAIWPRIFIFVALLVVTPKFVPATPKFPFASCDCVILPVIAVLLTDVILSEVIEPANFALVTPPSANYVVVTEPACKAWTVAVVLKPKCLTTMFAPLSGTEVNVNVVPDNV